MKERVEHLTTALRDTARDYRNGFDIRTVECLIHIDFAAKERVYVNADTGEEVKRKPMSPEDYQTEAFPDGDLRVVSGG
jgi:hypothetical protein